jgi:hypothetical protein
MTSKVAKLQRACLTSPVKVEVATKYSTVDTLRQQYIFMPAKYKDCYLAYVLTGGRWAGRGLVLEWHGWILGEELQWSEWCMWPAPWHHQMFCIGGQQQGGWGAYLESLGSRFLGKTPCVPILL